MSGPQKLTIVRCVALPLGHLWLELLASDCGALRWALRVTDHAAEVPGPAGPPIASGAVDDEFRRDVEGLAPAVADFVAEVAA